MNQDLNQMNNDLSKEATRVLIDGSVYNEAKISTLEALEAHYKLAKTLYDKSDLYLAEEHFKKALQLAEKPRDFFKLFKIYGFLIRICSELQDAQKTEIYIKESEFLVEEMPSILGSLNSEYLLNVGIVKNYRGKFIEAENHFKIAYSKSKEESEPEILAKALFSLANNAFQQHKSSEALRYLDELKELLNILNKTYMLGSMYLLYGNVFSEKDENENALAAFKKANAAFQEKTCWNLFGYVLLGMGHVYKKKGELNKAAMNFDLAKQCSNPRVFKRLTSLLVQELTDINDSTVDLCLDRVNRVIHEKSLGLIDFKHRFVLLEILFLLAKNPGTPFNKEELAHAIWKDEYNPLIHDKLIYTSVSRLRKLIEQKGMKRKYILRGKDGYTFNPHVKIRFQRAGDLESSPSLGNIELSTPV